MKEIGRLVHLLRNTPVRELVRALEQESLLLKRSTRTGAHIYHHPDGRILAVHYHRGSDTLTRKTLRSYLEATGWTEEDLKRLKLI